MTLRAESTPREDTPMKTRSRQAGGSDAVASLCATHMLCIATVVLYSPSCDEPGVQTMAIEAGLYVRTRPRWAPHVRLGTKTSVLPMHGKGKELGTGLVMAIKKQLGLL